MKNFPTMHGRCVVFITSVNTVFANYPSYVSSCSKHDIFQSPSVQLSSINIFLSHDWPQSIEQYGDLPNLLNRKSFLRQDIDSGTLGSPPLMGLLRSLKPQWWFAAHMHTRYEARVVHESQTKALGISQNPDEILIQDDKSPRNDQPAVENSFLNPDEITLSDEAAIVETPPPPPNETKFLALDKCLPRRQFLEVRV
jgi:lariat debranching enzyme